MRANGFDLIDSDRPTISMQWPDVTRISTYKRDLFSIDSVCLLFELVGDRSVEVWEEDKGFGGLADHLHECFNEVPIDWFEVVVQSPFATNSTLLFDRRRSPAA